MGEEERGEKKEKRRQRLFMKLFCHPKYLM